MGKTSREEFKRFVHVVYRITAENESDANTLAEMVANDSADQAETMREVIWDWQREPNSKDRVGAPKGRFTLVRASTTIREG